MSSPALPLSSAAPPGYEAASRRLRRSLGQAVVEYSMIAPGDRILVALSGGKDSYTLLVLLDGLRPRAPIPFELVPVHLDQGHPGHDGAPLRSWLEERGGEFHILEEDTYSVISERIPSDKTTCGLCSRLRRGILYSAARRLGCSKIALGHHRDDVVETLLLNLFFEGQLKTMPPILRSDDGRNTVIRPLYAAAERDIEIFARARGFPIVPCGLCGSREGAWRREVKMLLKGLERRVPNIHSSILAALRNVRPSHLPDRGLWERLGIRIGSE